MDTQRSIATNKSISLAEPAEHTEKNRGFASAFSAVKGFSEK
jgi:hypothetical protein